MSECSTLFKKHILAIADASRIMPHIFIDDFVNPLGWSALDPEGDPSSQIQITADSFVHPFSLSSHSLGITIESGAAGHRIRRTIEDLDLTTYAAIALWHRSDVRTQGHHYDPLRLRLAFGSAAMPIGAPQNNWLRYLVADHADSWCYSICSLDDLPTQVRSSLQTIEIQVLATDSNHTIRLDGLEAQTSLTIQDIDAALLEQLDSQLILHDTPVPAAIQPLGPIPAATPAFLLSQYQAKLNPQRELTGYRRRDFTDAGYSVQPNPTPWDVFYRIQFAYDIRNDLAAMQDFVISKFGSSIWLRIGNRAMRMEMVDDPDPQIPTDNTPILRYRVSAWIDQQPISTVLPVQEPVLRIP